METTALRQLLKSLCNNSPWNYGVFWKLKHHSDLILAWEDGYCHQPKPRETVEPAFDDVYFSGAKQMLVTSIHDGGSTGYPIGLAVADMSHLQHTFGKGAKEILVDQCFLEPQELDLGGNHSWVFLESLCSRESHSKLVPEYPDEWLLQFALGIKTILLVPLLPFGVLQLGSLEMVPEDPAVVAFLEDRFNTIHNVVGKTVPFTLIKNFQAQSPWSQSSSLVENTFDPSAVTLNPLKFERSEDVGSIMLNDNLLSTLGQFMQLPTNGDSLIESGTDQPEILKSTVGNEIGVPPICYIGESSPLSQSIDTSLLEMMGTQMFGLSCTEEELLAYSQFGGYNVDGLGESFSGLNSYSTGVISEKLFKDNIPDDSHNRANSFFSFPENCELHKALGTGFQSQANEHLWHTSMSIDDTCSSTSLPKDLISNIEPPWFSRGSDAENLFEALVAKDDTSSSRSDNIKSCITSLSQFSASCKQLKFEASAPIGSGSVAWNHTSPLLAGGLTPASTTGMMSNLVDEEHQRKGFTSKQPKREQKLSGASARRSKPGNSSKIRPRDRQLIQDRVKELRELVPSSAKCSIDGLLEKTIKHMLYLRSMTDQAEKLRCNSSQEVARSNNLGEAKSGCENGTSRAFEIGSETLICPIVVEDLELPGHMLIEMPCDEHGLFLDIAQAIRRLELTILKGTMETRLSNMWAHFVVEAPRGFHRMDVFWPLLHLLQRRKSSTISSKI